MSAFWVKLGANDVNCVGVPLNLTHSRCLFVIVIVAAATKPVKAGTVCHDGAALIFLKCCVMALPQCLNSSPLGFVQVHIKDETKTTKKKLADGWEKLATNTAKPSE